MTRSTTRRRYLTVVSSGSIAAVAGCSETLDNIDSDREEPMGEDGKGDGEGATVENVDHKNPNGSVAFAAPEDGAEVATPVQIRIEVENFEVQSADDEGGGDEARDDGAGHMHVLVDRDCIEPGDPIPFEEGYHHLGDGGLETELDLDPGAHDLCLQAADDSHYAYDLTDQITIEVVEGSDGDTGDGNESTNESTANDSSGG